MRRIFLISLLFVAACNSPKNEDNNTSNTTTPATTVVPTVISYQVVNEYPHDPAAFTEGLEYVNGTLYESVGEYGTSDLRKTELKTGKVLMQTKMDKKYFGEGLTVLNGKVYQLTYRERTGFVYDQKTLKQERTFSIPAAEGWGMTNDGKYLIFDDGSNILHYLDPATLQEVKQVGVNDERGAVDNINELEYIKGYIYANVWRTDIILKIDPNSGQVVGRADLSDLREKTGIPPMSQTDPKAPEVMNGIAYDTATNRIFITGKYWPKLFEVKLDN